MAALAGLSGLQTLNLDGTEVSESGLEHLASHPLLSSLSLAGIAVADGDRALQIISGGPCRLLALPPPRRPDDGWVNGLFVAPSGLSLTQLTLPGRRCVTDGGLASLSRLTLLSELDLTDYTQVTDQGMAHLASMTRSASSRRLIAHRRGANAAPPPLQVEEAVA